MKRSELFLSICFVCFVICLCYHSGFVSESFADGLQLWYNGLVPVLLPFLLVSGVFLSMLDLEHPNKIICLCLLFLCGLFCGYPVGAVAIQTMYEHRVISKRFSCAVLPLCNNVSPMFLIGYIYQPYLAERIPFIRFLLAIYLPQLLYAVYFGSVGYLLACIRGKKAVDSRTCVNELAAAETGDSIILDSIRTITVIGVYIAVFSVLFDTVVRVCPDSIPIQAAACFLEITKGVSRLSILSVSAAKKTALLLSLTAFGGISSLLQSMHILKNTDLSFAHYLLGKFICSVLTFVCAVCLL